jgi:hypothetical protein
VSVSRLSDTPSAALQWNGGNPVRVDWSNGKRLAEPYYCQGSTIVKHIARAQKAHALQILCPYPHRRLQVSSCPYIADYSGAEGFISLKSWIPTKV